MVLRILVVVVFDHTLLCSILTVCIGSRGGHTECVAELLAQPRIQVNVQNKLGDTPLHNGQWLCDSPLHNGQWLCDTPLHNGQCPISGRPGESSSTRASQCQIHSQQRRLQWSGAPGYGDCYCNLDLASEEWSCSL